MTSNNFKTPNFKNYLMNQYILELITIAGIHLLAVMSPGPDFAMIVKQSIVHSRRTALWTSVGLGLGIAVHVFYSLVGIGLVISQSIILFNIIKWVGALYLIYIGIMSLRSKPKMIEQNNEIKDNKNVTTIQAIKAGFLTNALNPKATLFFLALFTQAISPNTPTIIKLVYGIEMILATITWFAFVSIVLTNPSIKGRFLKISHIIERFTGAVLIFLGLKIIVDK
jgi:RhtB (resistance to homoserine/threonine) family protein